MTKATLYLRIASALTLVHCIAHTAGGVFSAPPQHPVEASVLATMKAATFPVMGAMRSYWDFFFGYGLFVSVLLLTESVVFWQLSALAKSPACRIRPLLGTFLFSFLGFAVVAARYFFLAPAINEVFIAGFLALAFFAADSSPKSQPSNSKS